MVDCCTDSEGFRKMALQPQSIMWVITQSNDDWVITRGVKGHGWAKADKPLRRSHVRHQMSKYGDHLRTASSHLFQRCAWFSVSAFALPHSVCIQPLNTFVWHMCMTASGAAFVPYTLCERLQIWQRGCWCHTHTQKKTTQKTYTCTNVVWHSAGGDLLVGSDLLVTPTTCRWTLRLCGASASRRCPKITADSNKKAAVFFCRRCRSFFNEATGTRWHLFFFFSQQNSCVPKWLKCSLLLSFMTRR